MADSNDCSNDPRQHTAKVKRMFDDLVTHLREDTEKFDEPKAQAICETSAEVILGLKKAFDDYDQGSEKAMQTRAG